MVDEVVERPEGVAQLDVRARQETDCVRRDPELVGRVGETDLLLAFAIRRAAASASWRASSSSLRGVLTALPPAR